MTTFRRVANFGAREAWLWRHRRHSDPLAAAESPRLFVDVSAIMRHDAQTGIQRVVRAVWSELSQRNGRGFEVLPVHASNSHGYCYAPADFLASAAAADRTIEPVRVRRGDRFLGLDLSAHLLPKYRRQLRAWRSLGAQIHLVVYDLLPLQRPSWFTASAVSHFGKWFDVVAQEADQAICISNDVAREVSRRFDEAALPRRPMIGRVRLGADIAGSVPSVGVCADVLRILEQVRFRPAVLMVGTVEPRKGYEPALAAFEHLWRSRPDSPDLIIVGKPGWKTQQLQARLSSHAEFGRRLHWFDRMSDEGLCLLYEACRGVLIASRGEGWGLPLVEAAMHRRFVLARDLEVFREHGLPNVVYFADESPLALAERIVELVNLGQSPAPAARLPTWSDCVDGLLTTIDLVGAKQPVEEQQQLLREAS